MRAMQALHPAMDPHVLDAPHLVLQRKPVEAAACIHEFLLPRV